MAGIVVLSGIIASGIILVVVEKVQDNPMLAAKLQEALI